MCLHLRSRGAHAQVMGRPNSGKTTLFRALAGLGVVVIGTIAVVAIVTRASPTGAEPQGVRWARLGIDDALREAGDRHQRVLVKFDAEWCSYCKKLEEEVLATRTGAELTRDMIAVRYDFDDPSNRSLVERYVVLGLPTVLVLTPDGTQVGRIMGYDGKNEWLTEARAAKRASDPVPALRAAHAASPADPHRALELGEALLVRGAPDEGEALLERVTWMRAADGSTEDAANALFLLGRYYHRVRRDPRTARHVWRELASRFPRSENAGGAWWWYAKAEAELGRHEVGYEALRARARAEPANVDAAHELADYVAEHSMRSHFAEARTLLTGAIPRAPESDRRDMQALATRLAGTGAAAGAAGAAP